MKYAVTKSADEIKSAMIERNKKTISAIADQKIAEQEKFIAGGLDSVRELLKTKIQAFDIAKELYKKISIFERIFKAKEIPEPIEKVLKRENPVVLEAIMAAKNNDVGALNVALKKLFDEIASSVKKREEIVEFLEKTNEDIVKDQIDQIESIANLKLPIIEEIIKSDPSKISYIILDKGNGDQLKMNLEFVKEFVEE